MFVISFCNILLELLCSIKIFLIGAIRKSLYSLYRIYIIMAMIDKKLLLPLIIVIMVTPSFVIFENIVSSAFACQNAKGCHGSGSSYLAPPEVSGCHYFPPVGSCAQSSTPPQMGQGPK
jgi:hypothetical protein